MLRDLRNSSGEPNLGTRLVALLVLVGLLVLTAPVALLPALAALHRLLF